jgi:hypothetical protein
MTVAGGVSMALNHGDLFMFEAPKKHAGKSSVPGTTPAAPRFDLAQTSLRAGLEA